ncbi:MAG: V4R domain-containing protein [Gemmatimonadales bacterium]
MTAHPPAAASRPPSQVDGLSIGRDGLRALHQNLQTYAPEQAIAILQQTGYAAGESIYRAFCAWLPGGAGVDRPEELDAARLNDVLSRFFQAAGWGSLTVSPLPGAALAVDSIDWSEAEPGAAQAPMCFFSAGLLTDFLGRLSGEPVAVMEVECRSKSDGRCRFLTATPETLQRVYERMTEGKTYEEALQT